MKQNQLFKWVPAFRLWRVALVLMMAFFSIEAIFGGSALYLGVAYRKEADFAAGAELKFSTQTTSNGPTFGWELNIPGQFVLFEKEEFVAAGITTGPRLGVRINHIEPMVTGNIGFLGALPLSDSGFKLKFVKSVEFGLKYWFDEKEGGVSLGYRTNYGLTKKKFGMLMIGVEHYFFLGD